MVVSNHASLADCFVIHYLSRMSILGDDYSPMRQCEQFSLPIINFFSWFLVWRVPTVKILLHMLKSDENWELELKSLSFVFSRLLRSKFSEWVVLFPEVNIWTPNGAALQGQVSNKYFCQNSITCCILDSLRFSISYPYLTNQSHMLI